MYRVAKAKRDNSWRSKVYRLQGQEQERDRAEEVASELKQLLLAESMHLCAHCTALHNLLLSADESVRGVMQICCPCTVLQNASWLDEPPRL